MASGHERIELLADELFSAALTTRDFAGARTHAAVALDRIIERDPELARLSEILCALHKARDAYAATSACRPWRQAETGAFASA